MHWETIVIVLGAITALGSVIAFYVLNSRKNSKPFRLNHDTSSLLEACGCEDPERWRILKTCFFDEIGKNKVFTEAEMLEHFVNIVLSNLPIQEKREAITASFEVIVAIIETHHSLHPETQA